MPANQPITSDQKREIGSLGFEAIEEVLDELNLDSAAAQRVLKEGGGEIAVTVREAVFPVIRRLALSNEFADEEVASAVGYFSGYKKPNGIRQQTNRLRELIKGVGFANEVLVKKPLPKFAEGFFAIPRWETVAPTYGEAVQKVQDLLKKERNGQFSNYHEEQLGPDQLRQHARSAAFWEKLGEAQKGYDILVVPAQFGLCHRGRSVRRARVIFTRNEFGLGAFATGIMLLTHANRLQHYADLWIDCAGDEFAPEAGGQFVAAPIFYFLGGEVGFSAHEIDNPDDDYGSASAFLLK